MDIRQHILISNDDGYDAKGIQLLKSYLKKTKKYEVYLVAPFENQSGASHSLSIEKPLEVKRVQEKEWFVKGTPTDCVLLSHYSLLKNIDLVLSGINYTPNMGEDVIYSGTVAAAMEASLLGYSAIALSAVSIDNLSYKVEIFIKNLVKLILNKECSFKHTLLNVNFPRGEIKGIKITRLGKRIYKDVVEYIPAGNRNFYILKGEPSFEKETDTDFDAVYNGYISITPLRLDLTNTEDMNDLKKTFKRLKEVLI